jgi:hypothetical protein
MNVLSRFAIAAVSCVCSFPTIAANLILNPSFENVATTTVSGDSVVEVPLNWTQTSSIDGCAFQALLAGESPYFGGDFTVGVGGASLATDGNRVLISDQGPNNCTTTIYQDVTIPAGGATLTLAAGAVFEADTLDSSVSVDVTTTGGTQLLNVYSRTDTQGNDALADRAPVDLSPYAGQTIRIIGTATVPGSDWTGLLMDNVRLMSVDGVPTLSRVPTLSQWGLMVLSGMLVLGVIALNSRRTRQ